MRGSNRWVEVSGSQFPHEDEGLAALAAAIPDASPYRVWSNFEFRDSQGRWHECDAMVLTRSTLYLVELKYYSGTLHGDDLMWQRSGGRHEDSPLKLARRKAQRLASKLKDECAAWLRKELPHLGRRDIDAKVRQIVPFVKEAVFLHHPDFVCALPQSCCTDLYGLDGSESTSHLPGISELITAPPRREPIGENTEKILAALMKRIGLTHRREREAGSWTIQENPIGEGDGWQEWLVNHRFDQAQQGKARIYTATNESQLAAQRRMVKHEFAATHKLRHESIEAPRDYLECDQGPALIFDLVQNSARLDLWLREHNKSLTMPDRVTLIRQIADAVHYAHRQGLAHRQLTPEAVSVGDSPLLAKVGSWVLAGSADGSTPAQTVHSPAPSGSDDDSPWVSFFAPEAAWGSGHDRTRADVFSVGALAYYIVSGKVPATSKKALRERLKREGSLDVLTDAPNVPAAIAGAIKAATLNVVAERTGSLADFVDTLTKPDDEVAQPETIDPTQATPGTVLDGRFTVKRRLGQGATAVALLVQDSFDHRERKTDLVLKVLTSDTGSELMHAEAEQLKAISGHKIKNVVQLVDGPIWVGGRSALLLSSAGNRTLADIMSDSQHMPLELLNTFGENLLRILASLEKFSIFHRDIKPANLGVSARNKLTLFDFSLAGAAANQVTVGTRAYLDPFLGTGEREFFDDAAERYSVAVVLFELATGRRPQFGDGMSDPAAIADEANVAKQDFDPALADGLVKFFRKSLARDAHKRYPGARAMLAAWQRVFTKDITIQAAETHDAAAERASLTTSLAEAGLTPSALSVTRIFKLTTVADFLTCGTEPLLRSADNCSQHTQREIRKRFRLWESRLGMPETQEQRNDSVKSDWDVLRDTLLHAKGAGKSTMPLAKLIFGLGGDVSPFAGNRDLGKHLPRGASQQRVGQLWQDMLAEWDANQESREVIKRWQGTVRYHVDKLGGLARDEVLLDSVLREVSGDAAYNERTYTYGLIRVAAYGLYRSSQQALGAGNADGADDPESFFGTSRKSGFVLLSTVRGLASVVTKSAPRLDRLFGSGKATRDDLITHQAVVLALRADVEKQVAQTPELAGVPAVFADDVSMVAVVASAADVARATSRGGVHHRDLSARRAVEFVVDSWPSTHQATPQDVRREVQERFPFGPELPQDDAELVKLVTALSTQWTFDGSQLVSSISPTSLTDLATVTSYSSHVPASQGAAIPGDVLTPRMVSSIQKREFVAFSVPALTHAGHFVDLAVSDFGAQEFNVSRALLAGLRGFAQQHGADWQVVLASDAPHASKHDSDLLKGAMAQVAGGVAAQVTELMGSVAQEPLLLTDVGLLYRYQQGRLVTELADISRPRNRPVWLVLPHRDNLPGSQVGDEVVRLSAKSQVVQVDRRWLAARRLKESA